MRVPLGAFGEAWAVGYLSRLGYRIVDRNVRYRCGELDIVAWDRDQLVFVEVKCRRSSLYGSPEESITAQRYAHLAEASSEYVRREGHHDASIRLDLVAIEVGKDGKVERCNLIRGLESPAR